MSWKEIIESFTKKEIQSCLKKLNNTDYRSSWKKSKLVDQVLEYDIEEVLNSFTSNQLKEGLEILGEATTGNKAVRLARLNKLLHHKEITDTDLVVIQSNLQHINKKIVVSQLDQLGRSIHSYDDLYKILQNITKKTSIKDMVTSFSSFRHGYDIVVWCIRESHRLGKQISSLNSSYCITVGLEVYEWGESILTLEQYNYWGKQHSKLLEAYIFSQVGREEYGRCDLSVIPNEMRFDVQGTMEFDWKYAVLDLEMYLGTSKKSWKGDFQFYSHDEVHKFLEQVGGCVDTAPRSVPSEITDQYSVQYYVYGGGSGKEWFDSTEPWKMEDFTLYQTRLPILNLVVHKLQHPKFGGLGLEHLEIDGCTVQLVDRAKKKETSQRLT